jgi:hypothetical protein
LLEIAIQPQLAIATFISFRFIYNPTCVKNGRSHSDDANKVSAAIENESDVLDK